MQSFKATDCQKYSKIPLHLWLSRITPKSWLIQKNKDSSSAGIWRQITIHRFIQRIQMDKRKWEFSCLIAYPSRPTHCRMRIVSRMRTITSAMKFRMWAARRGCVCDERNTTLEESWLFHSDRPKRKAFLFAFAESVMSIEKASAWPSRLLI